MNEYGGTTMHPTPSKPIRLATILSLLLMVATALPALAGSFSEPLDLLGIKQFECRCSQSRESGSDEWLWLFMAEPTIGAVDPDGPSYGRLREGDVLVAVDGRLITTRAGGERFSSISPGEAVELTVRRGAFESREWIEAREAVEPSEQPELERSASDITINLAELSEGLEALARISPELSELSELPELPELPGLPELPDLSFLSELSKLSELEELSVLGDLEIDTRPLGWFGIGLSFSGSMLQRQGRDELPRWDFDAPPKVSSLDTDGPAERAGLERGDRLTHIDGVALDSPEGSRRFSEVRPGQVVDWTVRRHGRSLTIPVTAEEQPE
jgi:hypothetical protein